MTEKCIYENLGANETNYKPGEMPGDISIIPKFRENEEKQRLKIVEKGYNGRI